MFSIFLGRRGISGLYDNHGKFYVVDVFRCKAERVQSWGTG